jgi:hypothetical protein
MLAVSELEMNSIDDIRNISRNFGAEVLSNLNVVESVLNP